MDPRPWTISAARYQHLRGVKQPMIAEVSSLQIARMSKRGRRAYDERRRAEWQASSDVKQEWRAEVVAAFDAGEFDLDSPDLHPDARSVALLHRRELAKAAAKEEARRRDRENRLDLEDLEKGMRVWHVIYRKYGTVTRVSRKSFRVKFEDGGREMRCYPGTIARLSPADLAAG